MPEKKYQIFVSSTYEDLKDERSLLYDAILKSGHIPAGMEYFPSINEDQMDFIEREIDASDYYVLLLGARYGSMDSDGISYTEKEFDYAVKQKKKIIALIHSNPDDIPRGKTDKDEERYQKLMQFKEKVKTGRLVAFWKDKQELLTKFLTSLNHPINNLSSIECVQENTTESLEREQNNDALEYENHHQKETIKKTNNNSRKKICLVFSIIFIISIIFIPLDFFSIQPKYYNILVEWQHTIQFLIVYFCLFIGGGWLLFKLLGKIFMTLDKKK